MHLSYCQAFNFGYSIYIPRFMKKWKTRWSEDDKIGVGKVCSANMSIDSLFMVTMLPFNRL